MRDKLTYINEYGQSVVLSVKNGYVVETFSGASGNSVKVATSQGVGQVGANVESEVTEPVPMTITGMILGSRSEGDARAKALLDVILPGIKGRIYHNDSYYRNVTPTNTPIIEAVPQWRHFQFSLLAAYPHWLKDQSTTTLLTGVTPKFKFPWNISREYRFGEYIETVFIPIVNNGQLPCPFTVTFFAKGAVENPRIVDAITGEYMQLNRTLEAGERVTVQITHDLTYVTSTLDGDIRGDLDIDSTLWRLKVGTTLIKPEAESGVSNVVVSIDRAIEKVGIILC